jgi:hypothetical protein
MNAKVSTLALLKSLGPLGQVEREAYEKVITLLQGNSEKAITGVDGAAPGMFGFRGTDRPWRKWFAGLPLFDHIAYVEWPPEREEGAPIAKYAIQPPEARPIDGALRMPESRNRIVKTRYLHLALIDPKGAVDFDDLWALTAYSTGHTFFDNEFAAKYPVSIKVEGETIQGPRCCRKWRFDSEPHGNTRGTWLKINTPRAPSTAKGQTARPWRN